MKYILYAFFAIFWMVQEESKMHTWDASGMYLPNRGEGG
jgi:hypothetical protein